MKETDILSETDNLYLCRSGRALEVRLNGNAHSVVVGLVKDIGQGIRFMAKAENNIAELRAFMRHPA